MGHSAEQAESREALRSLSICVIIPTYNNERTVMPVVEEVLSFCEDVIVVNDGATDNTPALLRALEGRITLVGYPVNKGKGHALQLGFAKARELGFSHALTLDSDGQHYPSDIPKFIAAHREQPEAMLMGARDLNADGMPGKNTFANKFSNFWFFVETGIRMPDTQTGFRLYPLKEVGKLWLFTHRFEFEVEVIVKLAWRGVPFRSVPIRVKYDPSERVSHFRPGPDFTRISFLNAYLFTLAMLWHLPLRLLRGGKVLKLIRDEALNPSESNLRKAASIGLGVFFGILPIWGFQLLTGIPTAILLRLNKVLFIAAANVSIPPMVPFIIYLSYLLGGPLTDADPIVLSDLSGITLETIHENFVQYLIGAVLLALLAGCSAFAASLALLRLFRQQR